MSTSVDHMAATRETGADEMEAETPTKEFQPHFKQDQSSAGDGPALAATKSLEHQVTLLREISVIGLISLAQFTTQMGLGQMLIILHVVGDHFGVQDPGSLSWLIAGYSLTVGTFILFSGRLGDLFGWKRMLIIGFVWFAVWSIVAGLAWYSNHVLFVFARVMQGIGPALTFPNGVALLGGLYEPGKRKNMAFAVFGSCAPFGFVVGAACAGLWALTWWPWTFITFGIALFGIALAAAWAIPDPQGQKPGLRGSVVDKLSELDFFPAVTGITGLVLLNFAWNQAPIAGWQSPYVIVALVLSVILLPTFIWLEVKTAAHPLIPLSALTTDNTFVLGCVACGWANFGIWTFYLIQILEVLRGTSPLLTTAYLTPITVCGAFAAILTGILMSKVRPAMVMVIALCAFLTGSVLIATLPVHQIYWAQIFICTLLTPFGMDMSFPSATLVVSDSVGKVHQGVAASLVCTIVNYSISLGLGFAGTVEVHVNHNGVTAADVLEGYRGALYMAIGLSGSGLCLALVFLLKSYGRDRRKHSNAATKLSAEA